MTKLIPFAVLMCAIAMSCTTNKSPELPVDDRPHIDDRLSPAIIVGDSSMPPGTPNYPKFTTWVLSEHSMDIALDQIPPNADYAHFQILTRDYMSPTNNTECQRGQEDKNIKLCGGVLSHSVVRSVRRGNTVYTDGQLGCDPRNLLKCTLVDGMRLNNTYYLVLGQQVLGYFPKDKNKPELDRQFAPVYELEPDVVINRELELNGVRYYPLAHTAQFKEGIQHFAGVLYLHPLKGTWTRAVWSGPTVHRAIRLEQGAELGFINVVTRGFRPEDPEQTVVLKVMEGAFTVQ